MTHPRNIVIPAQLQPLALSLFLTLGGCTAINAAPIVQPGMPGEAGRNLTPDEAVAIADTSYSPADAMFMKKMIPHHSQALDMAALVASRTNRRELLDIAGRIKASQSDEIDFMNQWLMDRNEVMDGMHHGMSAKEHAMMGMASPEQMMKLSTLDAVPFDRFFLELMIRHHEGAVDMVKDLLDQPGSAHDPVLYEFVGDIKNDQLVEIERMHALLVTLSNDPRANLTAGLYDAGIAIENLQLVASLPKPPGFIDPENPKGISKADKDDSDEDAKPEPIEGGSNRRSPMLSFSNSDMAFSGNTLVAGNYHGFNIYQLAEDGIPDLLSSVVCPGGQGDVSIVGDLLIMSVEQTRGRLDCGLQGISEDVSEERFRGIRIFDISDLERPLQVGAVQTCRGSHTHTVVTGPGDEGKIIVYNSGTSSIRDREEMETCFDESPGDTRTALFRIDVIEIPVDDPSMARIVHSPTVFADEKTGVIAGLWRGGDHGDDTQETRRTEECHDITVFPSKKLAAGACSGNGILFDISDPMDPKRIDVVVDEGFAYWHSATFNNDGTKVLFTDEWGGGSRPRCRTYDPLDWGADAIYDIIDGKLEFKSYYKIPAPQLEQENCVAHNGSIVPVPGRDIFVQAWYQGGISVIDFTDSSKPVEIAYFDRGPIDEEELILGGFWSTYWYRGNIYGTEIVRGLDIFRLKESEHISANEIAATHLADQGNIFNPQQQFPVSWPAHPQIGLAYLDQLARNQNIDGTLMLEIDSALSLANAQNNTSEINQRLSQRLRGLSDRLKDTGDSGLRLAELMKTLADQMR
ncbi:MAG: DUF305 domain-containing protein [Candidatus Marinimicrobia bacterium]|nr:DUF305 domain-containing protein [Candidatus Neomarinimicrobiota bacterium]